MLRSIARRWTTAVATSHQIDSPWSFHRLQGAGPHGQHGQRDAGARGVPGRQGALHRAQRQGPRPRWRHSDAAGVGARGQVRLVRLNRAIVDKRWRLHGCSSPWRASSFTHGIAGASGRSASSGDGCGSNRNDLTTTKFSTVGDAFCALRLFCSGHSPRVRARGVILLLDLCPLLSG